MPDNLPVSSTEFWKTRIDDIVRTGDDLKRSVLWATFDKWGAIEREHVSILAQEIKCSDSVLDAGCGYGRLLDFMPDMWHGDYVGVDISPDFIAIARTKYPDRNFILGDLLNLPLPPKAVDVAIVCSVRTMVVRHLGEAIWSSMEHELCRVSSRILYLTFQDMD